MPDWPVIISMVAVAFFVGGWLSGYYAGQTVVYRRMAKRSREIWAELLGEGDDDAGSNG